MNGPAWEIIYCGQAPYSVATYTGCVMQLDSFVNALKSTEHYSAEMFTLYQAYKQNKNLK